MTQAATVFAIDDDPLILSILAKVLSDANLPVKTYTCGEDFLKSYSTANPGCILIDMLMPGIDGLELQQTLKTRGNVTPVIFLSGADTVQFAVEALKSGAMDFLEKPIAASELVTVVEKALKLDMQNRFQKLQYSHNALKLARLTPRESEVMQLMLEGNPNKMIARILDISSRTVEVHRKNIFDKMEADSLVLLARTVAELRE